MIAKLCRSAAALLMLAEPWNAQAATAWLGLYRHDVTLAQTRFEGGEDLKVGYMGERIDALRQIGRPSWHVIASKSLSGETDYLAAGLDWRLGGTLYARPGIGMAVHDGPSRAYRKGRRVDLGSPVLFEPELAFGWQLNPRLAIEASWIHLSHATIFSRQNRGMDSWGLRLLVGLR
jgi:lipid A 3-O-deacylase